MRQRVGLLLLSSALVMVLGLGLSRTVSAAPSALHVSGNQLQDAGGNPVLLRGANLSGTEFVCAQNWSNDPFGGQPEDSAQTRASMKGWGLNAVRIPLNEDCWLGINGVQIGGAAYQGAIRQLVSDYEAAGFYVILDLHWSAPGSQRALSQNPAPDADHSVAFWQGVASAFSSDGAVLFDLYNEPYFYWIADGSSAFDCLWNGCTLSQYVTGGQPYTVSQSWKSAGFTQLTAAIRGAGADNVIMAAGVDWANDLSGWLSHAPADANTVAAWHSYPGQGCSPKSCWDGVIAPIAARFPVVIGETGDSSSGPVTYMNGLLPWADAHGLSYTPWTWNAWQDGANILVTDMAAGTPTKGEGQFYKSYLAGLAVLPTPTPTPSPTPSPTPTATSTPTPTPSPSDTPTPTPIPSPTPASTPTATPLDKAPCVITVAGQMQLGVCSGTFTPS